MFRPYSALLIMILLAGAAVAQQPAATAVPVNLSSIVERMEQAAETNRANYRPYIVTRDYKFFGGNQEGPRSEVLAEISFVPPTTKEFKITEAKGSSRGESVVRHILEDESKAAASGNAPGAITRENYDFTYLGEQQLDGSPCFILGLKPKHSEKSLVVGRAWVDKQTYLVRRIDGQMAKLPSWWLKSVRLTLDFGNMDGMWIQKQTKAVADVRIFGTHVLNARSVKFETGAAVATKVRPPRRSRSSAYALGTAVIREH